MLLAQELCLRKGEYGNGEIGGAIVVQIEPRKNSRVGCSGCGRTASGYDHMSEARHFEFVPLWGMKVYFRYRMRRVNAGGAG